MKRSHLHLILLLLLGLIPVAFNLSTNFYQSKEIEYQLAVQKEALNAYVVEKETLQRLNQLQEHSRFSDEEIYATRERQLAIRRMETDDSSPVVSNGEVLLSAPVEVPQPVVTTTQIAEERIRELEQIIENTKKEMSSLETVPDTQKVDLWVWLQNHWMAILGSLNTLLFGWRWMHWRKEELNPVITEIFIGHNDLALLSIGERLKMLFKSFFDKDIRNIYRFRKDKHWSIYSGACATFDFVNEGRKVFAIRRAEFTWSKITDFFKGYQITEPNGESRMLVYGYTKTPIVKTARTIRVTPFFETLKEILDDGEDDYWILVASLKTNNGTAYYTAYLSEENIPMSINEWELFLYSFKDRHCGSVKDAVLESIIVISPKNA